MPLIEITDEQQWDAFVGAQPRAQFTQSWAWGAFRVARGQSIQRLAWTGDDGRIEIAALFVHFAKPLVGGYWYAPRGPVIRKDIVASGDASATLQRFLDAVAARGFHRPSLFWRIEPPLETLDPTPKTLIPSHAYMPASTLLIDLTKSEEELQKEMHEKTRYNIRVAERHGVTVRVALEQEAINAFLTLNEETASRDQFVSQQADYIRATYAFLAKQGMARLRFAEKEGRLLAASLEVTFGDTTTYLYGASSSVDRHTMAPYALHWDAMRAAKVKGKHYYDLHGVNPADESSPYFKKTWEGITRFKLGWGGTRVDFVGTWELPQQSFLYRVFRAISPS